jgi:TPR repeat protein
MKLETAGDVAVALAPEYSPGETESALAADRLPLQVFYSYSHKDEEFRIALESHLSPLQHQGLITAWHDRRIGAGDEWRKQIDLHLRSADIILLLVSADFIHSDYCFDVELPCALERHKDDKAIVIPIIVRPVDWSRARFAELKTLPRDGKAISLWSDRDEALMTVAQGVREAVLEQASRKPDPVAKPVPPVPDPVAKPVPPVPDPVVPGKWWSGKAKRVYAATVLLVVLAFVWAHFSNNRFTLPKDTTVESKLERGKYLYREQNYTGAADLFRQAAKNGSAEAADYLGILYEFGLGTQPDCKEAKTWFQQGAKANSSNAMDHLGLLFEHGCGVKLDNAEAKRWFEKSSQLGNADAMDNLGWMYANNLGVPTDYQQAMKYFQEAADRQNGDAMNNIGWLYQNGWGVPKRDLSEAVRWFRKAAAAKSTLGMNSLGWAYENGLGVPSRDYQQAMQWFRKAAEGGSSLGSNWAMNNLGDMFEKGYLGPNGAEEAIQWYKKAAENGFELAKSNLERLGIKAPEDRPCCPVALS